MVFRRGVADRHRLGHRGIGRARHRGPLGPYLAFVGYMRRTHLLIIVSSRLTGKSAAAKYSSTELEYLRRPRHPIPGPGGDDIELKDLRRESQSAKTLCMMVVEPVTVSGRVRTEMCHIQFDIQPELVAVPPSAISATYEAGTEAQSPSPTSVEKKSRERRAHCTPNQIQ